MPSIVAVSVRNCAIASNTFAAMSWSLLMSIDTKAFRLILVHATAAL